VQLGYLKPLDSSEIRGFASSPLDEFAVSANEIMQHFDSDLQPWRINCDYLT
jgi:hypothetical protein